MTHVKYGATAWLSPREGALFSRLKYLAPCGTQKTSNLCRIFPRKRPTRFASVNVPKPSRDAGSAKDIERRG